MSATLAVLLMTMAGVVQAAGPCERIIKSSRDAAEKSDWIVEAVVDDSFTVAGEDNRLDLMLSGMKIIKGEWPNMKVVSGTVQVGPCMPGGKAAFLGPAGKRLYGQRMRIYGSKHLDGPSRRAFYIEPVTINMQAARALPLPTETKVHRQDASNRIAGGWHRAHSSEGEYAIDMPAPFLDVTAISTGKAGAIGAYMLKAIDAQGTTFIAVREPNGPEQPMAGTFDTAVGKKGTTIVQFKGLPAIETRTVQGIVLMHSLMFRVPGGTYMLGVSLPKEREADSASVRERFYQSLAFD